MSARNQKKIFRRKLCKISWKTWRDNSFKREAIWNLLHLIQFSGWWYIRHDNHIPPFFIPAPCSDKNLRRGDRVVAQRRADCNLAQGNCIVFVSWAGIWTPDLTTRVGGSIYLATPSLAFYRANGTRAKYEVAKIWLPCHCFLYFLCYKNVWT